MSENIQQLQELLDCEILPIERGSSSEELMTSYLSLWEQGKLEGFTPIIVTADGTLLEKFEIDLEDEELPLTAEGMKIYREKIIAQANENIISNPYQLEKNELRAEVSDEEIDWEILKDEVLEFSSCLNCEDDENYFVNEDVVIVKLPTDKPYEAFAWLPMGGFNDCPNPAEMVAMARYWYEKYGAEPSAVTYDSAEFYVPNPTADKEAVIDLAIEQYLFDIDIVEQGVGDVESLVETIYRNKQWYFWWD